jgi:hypothetical protein
MQSRGDSDLPYWPTQNTYVYKEVWVHSTSRWLWLMSDLAPVSRATRPDFQLTATTAKNGVVTIRLTARGQHAFAFRADNLDIDESRNSMTLRANKPTTITWTARAISPDAAWTLVAFADGDVAQRRDVVGVPQH